MKKILPGANDTSQIWCYDTKHNDTWGQKYTAECCNPIGMFHSVNSFIVLKMVMDKLQLTGQNLGRVCTFRIAHVHVVHLHCYRVKLPDLKLKTRPKQLLGSLPLGIVLPKLVVNFMKKNCIGFRFSQTCIKKLYGFQICAFVFL
jgi:hypothetical protein